MRSNVEVAGGGEMTMTCEASSRGLCVVLLGVLLGCGEESPSGVPLAGGSGDVATAQDASADVPLSGDGSDGEAGDGPSEDVVGPGADLIADASDDAGSQDVEGIDATSDDADATPGCVADADCAGPGLAAPCHAAVCVEGSCSIAEVADQSACDDGDACTTDDACSAGLCAGEPVGCDDGDPCTDDACEPATGACVHPGALGAPCDDLDECTAGEACTGDGACSGGLAVCECVTDGDCAPKEDGDLCNGTLHCIDHTCALDPETIVACPDVAIAPCLVNTCVAATGGCSLIAREDATPCSDGTECTMGDSCQKGVCVGAKISCDDGFPCTVESCDPVEGCLYVVVSDGLPCDDTNACTASDQCASGLCVGSELSCDDENPCTIDSCAATTGCQTLPNAASCEDGNACTEGDVCKMGLCFPGGATPCDDGNLCTSDGCDPSAGCESVPNTLPCDDGDPCTLIDKCGGGACVGGGPTLPCEDKNPCTDDACTAGLGCVHVANEAPCDDGNTCTTGDTCANAACLAGASVCTCETNADCASYEDGDLCNGLLRCDKNVFPFACAVDPATVVACSSSDDTACLEATCQPATGACVLSPRADGSPCSDGDACTPADACESGSCLGAGAADCDDNNTCTDDTCDKTTGCKGKANAAPCDDKNACTTNDTCGNKGCHGGAALPCDDANPCTVDSCHVAAGCLHGAVGLPCNDDDPCTAGDLCEGGQCKAGPPTNCNDGNACTDDSCEPGLGCKTVPNTKSCNDGNACTTGDVCSEGACAGPGALACDDGNVCTKDLCDPAAGCQVAAVAGPCDDKNPCTPIDACQGTACVGTGFAACDDGNPCTDDGCAAPGGCFHTNNQAPCSDGDVCSVGDACEGGSCHAGAATPHCCNTDDECDDGSACTTDACANHVCASAGLGTTTYSEGFEGGDLAGWVATNDPEVGNDNVSWSVDTTSSSGGKAALYWGNPTTHTYDFGEALSAATRTLHVPYGVPILAFDLRMDVEDVDCESDFLTVYANGEWVGEVCGTDKAWARQYIDLSAFGGLDVDITLEVVVYDGLNNAGGGIWVDNVELRSTSCQGMPCAASSQCSPQTVCTAGLCVAGVCDFAPMPPSQIYGEDFDDVAQGATFTSTNPLLGWTVSTARKVSGTSSLYAGSLTGGGYDKGGGLVTVKLPKIRIPNGYDSHLVFRLYMDVADATCANDVLTVRIAGKTVGTWCSSTGGQWVEAAIDTSPYFATDIQPELEFKAGAGSGAAEGVYIDDLAVLADMQCAAPKETFESAVAFNFAVESTNPLVWWHVSTKSKKNGIRSFRAGNPSTADYNNGATVTTATTSIDVCPTGKLTFQLRQVVGDQGCDKDVFTVEVGPTVLYTRCNNTNGYEVVTLSLAAYAGMSIPVTFRFAADAANNAAEGVYLDDVALTCL